jgi:hypothetical protein
MGVISTILNCSLLRSIISITTTAQGFLWKQLNKCTQNGRIEKEILFTKDLKYCITSLLAAKNQVQNKKIKKALPESHISC